MCRVKDLYGFHMAFIHGYSIVFQQPEPSLCVPCSQCVLYSFQKRLAWNLSPSLKSGWATEIIALIRSGTRLYLRLATPCSVITYSTSVRGVVTMVPGGMKGIILDFRLTDKIGLRRTPRRLKRVLLQWSQTVPMLLSIMQFRHNYKYW